MSEIDLDVLLAASSAGGSSCLTSTTELVPAAGPQAAIAPAKFAVRGRSIGAYAYERRYLDGQLRDAVLVDSKQSQLNRAEQATATAIADGHSVLSRLPRIEVTYERDGVTEVYSDLSLPHRAFDGHIRAGSVDGTPVTQLDAYRAIRNSSPADARALLDASPISLIFGAWDSSRSSRQGRWRSVLTGEIVGFTLDAPTGQASGALKGGARVDPVGMQVKLTPEVMKQIAEQQRQELSASNYDTVLKEAAAAKKGERVSASRLGLGGIPPTLESLAGAACERIIRSHVLSFASLRQIRFGAGTEGDVACRALLAALALNALARSDSELVLRANCDLIESSPSQVSLDQRGGQAMTLVPLSIEAADGLLAAALAEAEAKAGISWHGVIMHVAGNPAIVAGAEDDAQEGQV